MKRLIILLIAISCLITNVYAMDFTVPVVPDSGYEFMPAETESFAEGFWFVIKSAIAKFEPSIAEASGACTALIAAVILISLLKHFADSTQAICEFVCVILISTIILQPTKSLVSLGVDTVTELSEYGKLMLPVLTAALAAQGGATSSAALYAGTTFFDAFLSVFIARIIAPMIYVFILFSITSAVFENELINKIKKFSKWLITWGLKIVLYVFTGYISITGIVSGTADASAIKAAKLAISGFVPVVGNIISDASETILISAGLMKSAAGIYGLIAFIAIWIGPFIKIGAQYIMLKAAAVICSLFSTKKTTQLLQDFSTTMGFLLAMTGAMCLLLLISTVCFMKGIT